MVIYCSIQLGMTIYKYLHDIPILITKHLVSVVSHLDVALVGLVFDDQLLHPGGVLLEVLRNEGKNSYI